MLDAEETGEGLTWVSVFCLSNGCLRICISFEGLESLEMVSGVWHESSAVFHNKTRFPGPNRVQPELVATST